MVIPCMTRAVTATDDKYDTRQPLAITATARDEGAEGGGGAVTGGGDEAAAPIEPRRRLLLLLSFIGDDDDDEFSSGPPPVAPAVALSLRITSTSFIISL